MAEAIVITAALRDEIAADLAAGGERAARWRPAPPDHRFSPVLVLQGADRAGQDAIGHVGEVRGISTVDGYPNVTEVAVLMPGEWFADAAAWAPVGGVDGGPRPDIGDRVIVLDAPSPLHRGRVGICCRIVVETGAILAQFDPEHPAEAMLRGTFAVTRWAILPPEVRVIESVTADDVARIHGATMAQPPPGWDETQRLRSALTEIVGTLGPHRVCTCTGPDCGIRTEAAEALRIAREALTTDVQGG